LRRKYAGFLTIRTRLGSCLVAKYVAIARVFDERARRLTGLSPTSCAGDDPPDQGAAPVNWGGGATGA
jgi:hypothetical protein